MMRLKTLEEKMKSNKMLFIFLVIIPFLYCSDDAITNIEFTPTDHEISKITKEMLLSIIIEYEKFYAFSADSNRLGCEGNACNDNLVSPSEMNDLAQKLSDTNYFKWQFMTAVTPYPVTDCNLLLYGKDKDGNHLDYMCTIGRGAETYKILIGLSKSFSGDASNSFIELANYYKN